MTPASCNDKSVAYELIELMARRNPRFGKLWADAGYISGPLSAFAAERQIDLDVVRPPHRGAVREGFCVEVRRWVVERTFAWLLRYRRLCRDYERLARSVEALIYVAMMRLVLRRLAPAS